MIEIPIKFLHPDVKMPRYAHVGDAGIDLASTHNATIDPFCRVMIHCGFGIQIPEGYAGLVLPRSSLGSKYGITLPNAPGLIDSDYRGEIMVPLINLDPETPFTVHAGDRVAQLLIVEAPDIGFVATDTLDDTERGVGGFGSSGK